MEGVGQRRLRATLERRRQGALLSVRRSDAHVGIDHDCADFQTSREPRSGCFRLQVPEGVSPYRTRYQVSKDGKRFLVYTQTNRDARPAITTVLNWTTALQR